MQGWRLVFHILAGLAGMTTALLFLFGVEPRTANCKVQLSGKTGQKVRGDTHMKFYASIFRHLKSSIKVCPLPQVLLLHLVR